MKVTLGAPVLRDDRTWTDVLFKANTEYTIGVHLVNDILVATPIHLCTAQTTTEIEIPRSKLLFILFIFFFELFKSAHIPLGAKTAQSSPTCCCQHRHTYINSIFAFLFGTEIHTTAFHIFCPKSADHRVIFFLKKKYSFDFVSNEI